MSQHEPTIAGILRLLADEYESPVDERRVLERVLERRPSNAKNPYATIRERLRWDGMTLGWLRLDRRRLVPLRIALHGLRFRCIPRARDIAEGRLPLAHLQPFAGLRTPKLTLIDEQQIVVDRFDAETIEADPSGSGLVPGFDLQQWYAATGFRFGDSIIVTISAGNDLVMHLEHEPQAAFQSDAVAAQDAELIDSIVDRVNRAANVLVPCDEVVLPIFATAAWRSAYPGTPWQYLVTHDPRLQLVDDIFLTNQRSIALRIFDNDEIFESQPIEAPEQREADRELYSEIDQLQRELHRSRQQDADAGIWDGELLRASAGFSRHDHTLHSNEDDEDPFSEFERLRDRIEIDYDDDWDDPDDPFDVYDEQTFDPESLRDAHRRMLAALPPDVAEQIETARPEQAEVLIAGHLNDLLVKLPDIFPRITLDLSPNDDVQLPEALQDLGEDWDDDEDWNDEDEIEDPADLITPVRDHATVYSDSSDTIAQFYDYLVETGKTAVTARVRARSLHVYAEFLAAYYSRSLIEGDYATLDECLFFYYPRRVMNTSPRQIREIGTSVKQFYAFLKQRGVIDDDRFATAIWRRRQQAARVVEIYDQIASDSPEFGRLFTLLFHPYSE